ncbi:MAG: hypothetical protein ACPGNV_04065 [Mangrovicoccus sp.]
MTFTKTAGAALLALVFSTAISMAATCNGPRQSNLFSLDYAGAAACYAGNDLNTISDETELFGLTGWTLAYSFDGSSSGDGKLGFDAFTGLGKKSGLWDMGDTSLAESVLVVLKAGRDYGAFLLTDTTSGNWSLGKKKLSHYSIWYRAADPSSPIGGPSPAPIPLPAALPLVLTACGLGLYMARRKPAA